MGAKLSSGGGSKFHIDQNSDINVTPFVDVMLVLLIIFMVAAPLASVSVEVKLPPPVLNRKHLRRSRSIFRLKLMVRSTSGISRRRSIPLGKISRNIFPVPTQKMNVSSSVVTGKPGMRNS